MITAKDNKKKKSGLPTIKPMGAMPVATVKETTSKVSIPSANKDLGQMKLQGIMDKIGSDRELESIKEVSGEAKRITEKFKKDPDEAWKESHESYPNALKKLNKRKGK